MYNCKFNDIGCFCINLYNVNFIKFVKNCKKCIYLGWEYIKYILWIKDKLFCFKIYYNEIW